MFKRRYLSIPQLKDVQTSLARYGVRRLTYLGGEPFLRKGFLSLCSHAKTCGLSTAVVTNGTCIRLKEIEKIIQGRLFDIMIFSLDGPPSIHDNIRAVKGTFRRAVEVIKNIQRLKKAQKQKYPRIFLYATLSALNCDYVEFILKLAQELNVHTLRFISASCLSKNIIEKTNALFKSCVIKTHAYAVGDNLNIPPGKIPALSQRLRRMEKHAKKIGLHFQVEEYLQNGKGAQICRFLGKDFIISAFGDICPCPMLPEYILGSLRDAPLAQILHNKLTTNKVRRLFKLCSEKKLAMCRQCCVEKLFSV